MNITHNISKLKDNYLFSKIASEKEKYKKMHPDKKIIDLGIGDVTLPLVDSAIEGIKSGLNNLSKKETFIGYPPSCGHNFLKEQIISHDYISRNISFKNEEIFIADSSKSDINSFLNIFNSGITVVLQNPVYPAYVSSNILKGNNIIYVSDILDIPKIQENVDIIYLCFPNNPTGKIATKSELEKIVNFAIDNDCIIFYDSAYEAFIQDKNIPHSIYEIENSKKVAIEFRSFSKTAGFTPLRLSYTVVPKETGLNTIFKKIKDISYNGPSYLSEYAMYNIYATNSYNELEKNISYYLYNTQLLADFFYSKKLLDNNKVNSPYVWIKCKNNMSSWEFFYYLLNEFQIVGTPGVGFGSNGENFFRLTGFGSKEDTLRAINRLIHI